MAISTTTGKFRKAGDTLDYTAAADISAGTVIVVDGVCAIALQDVANGDTAALKVLQRGEVVEITTDDAIGATDAGTALYVIPASGLVTKDADDGEDTPTAYKLLGYARAAIGATALSFEVVCA